ncbi:septum site-determining protein MinC [Castellaniella sp. GW247-6E4]|uniref:septum site-determining protein MinC n=1 Tax=Castellaniella sp. GW247-6E4 TaxID=3140380 RepID=UPI0033148664
MSATPKIALDFKSATLYALRAVLHSPDTSALIAALDQRMAEAGAFYENEPVVLDALALEQSPDWAAVIAALRRHALYPIGVLAEGPVRDQAIASGLAPVEVSGARQAPAQAQAAPQAPADAPEAPPATPKAARPSQPEAADAGPGDADADAAPGTMVIRHPLRSGQRIYARGCDLVVIGMVSQGAEVIADGNIHVYGPLRGKAMAGARGDTRAMILTTQLDPELLAIAGVYRVIETRLSDTLHKQPALVQLDGDTLRIRPL